MIRLMISSAYIKLILLLALIMAGQVYGQQDAIARYFGKYAEEDGFTSVYISAKMFRLMARLDKDSTDQSFQKAMNQLGGLRILAADSIAGKRYYKEIMDVLLINRYEELMRVKDEGGDMIFLIKENSSKKISELLMLIGGENSFFMLSIIGDDLDLEMISKIGESLDVQGMEKLENLEKR